MIHNENCEVTRALKDGCRLVMWVDRTEKRKSLRHTIDCLARTKAPEVSYSTIEKQKLRYHETIPHYTVQRACKDLDMSVEVTKVRAHRVHYYTITRREKK